MAFIKEEIEDMRIEETISVKKEDTEEQTMVVFIKEEDEDMRIEETIGVKHEDTEPTKMAFIKVESEDLRIEETFSVKQENTEQTKIKEQSGDIRIEETFSLKREDTEEQAKMGCIDGVKKQSEDQRIQVFSVKHTEVQKVLPYQFEPESDSDADDQSEPSAPARLQQDVSQWCRCGNCNRMPSEVEHICCMEIPKVVRRMNQFPGPLKCMIDHPGFEINCLNPYALQNILNIYKADYGPLRRRTEEERFRHLAHRSFVSWCWGYLARQIRVVLPSCVVLRIQQEFPDLDGPFVGFRPPLE